MIYCEIHFRNKCQNFVLNARLRTNLEDFHKSKDKKSGRISACKSCAKNSREKRKKTYLKPEIGTKLCKLCGQTKSYDEFKADKSNVDGCYFYCRKCEKQQICKYSSTFDGFIKISLGNLKKHANTRNIPFEIGELDVIDLFKKQNGKCALTGTEMTHKLHEEGSTRGKKYYHNISVDRIDSRLNYTKDNIQLVCSSLNVSKWDIPMEDFLTICRKVVEYNSL